jgi:hypothetical protein
MTAERDWNVFSNIVLEGRLQDLDEFLDALNEERVRAFMRYGAKLLREQLGESPANAPCAGRRNE